MDDLESQARQEFARILTKAMRTVNTLLDGRPWGGVNPDEFSAEQFGKNYIRLDYEGMGIKASMHASDEPVFSHSAARVWSAPVTEKESLTYFLAVHDG